jgi:NADH-quinone oxidoreductase subunit G
MREGLGVNHLDHRVGSPIFSLDEEGVMPGMQLEIGECENLDFAYLWGIDITEEFPIIWLRLKQAINKGAKLIFIGHFAPEILPHLAQIALHAPGAERDAVVKYLHEAETLTSSGKKVAHFIGRQYLASPDRRAILSKFPIENLNLLEGQGNSMGARFAGMHPELGPLGDKLKNPGLHAIQILENCAADKWDFLYVVGANPVRKTPSALWNSARLKLKFLVVQDLFLTETAKQADVVLPTLSYVEKSGTFINIERRVQKFHPGKDIPEHIYSDREIFQQLAKKINIELTLDTHFEHSLKQGKRLEIPTSKPKEVIDSEPKSSSHQLYASFAISLFDQGTRMQHNPHLLQLAKEPFIRLHPQEGQSRNIASGSKVRITSKHGSIEGCAKWDENVALNTAVIPLGFEALPAHSLDVYLMNGLPVEVHSC